MQCRSHSSAAGSSDPAGDALTKLANMGDFDWCSVDRILQVSFQCWIRISRHLNTQCQQRLVQISSKISNVSDADYRTPRNQGCIGPTCSRLTRQCSYRIDGSSQFKNMI